MVNQKKSGFTLIELMVVVAIIALLSLVALPKYWGFQAKAKRAEAYLNLSALHTAEKLYWAEHGAYTNKLLGSDSLDWQPEGQANYSYGFGGTAHTNYVPGKSGVDVAELNKYTHADDRGFTVAAIADIDGDGKFDILTIDQNREIKIVQDDLGN